LKIFLKDFTIDIIIYKDRIKSYIVNKLYYKLVIFTTLILVFFLISLTYGENNKDLRKGQIKWMPVDGAIGYQIKFKAKDEESLVIDETINKNEFSFNLPYGSYKYQIGIISKFNKIYNWSEWCSLKLTSPDELFSSVHIFGWSSGYLLPAFNTNNGYTGSVIGGVYYENHSFLESFPYLYRGLDLTSYYFVGSETEFSTSWMMTGSAFIGLDYPGFKTRGDFFHFSFFSGYKHYYRVHTYKNQEYVSSRPIVLAGAGIKFLLFNNLVLGANLEYNLVMDNSPANIVTAKFNVGFRL